MFELIRRKRHGDAAVLIAFDLIELDGRDLRREPIEHRKHKLSRLVRTPRPGIVLNEHYEGMATSFSRTPASSVAKALARLTSRDVLRIG